MKPIRLHLQRGNFVELDVLRLLMPLVEHLTDEGITLRPQRSAENAREVLETILTPREELPRAPGRFVAADVRALILGQVTLPLREGRRATAADGEVNVWLEALKNIAACRCPDPSEVARAALETQGIIFDRAGEDPKPTPPPAATVRAWCALGGGNPKVQCPRPVAHRIMENGACVGFACTECAKTVPWKRGRGRQLDDVVVPAQEVRRDL